MFSNAIDHSIVVRRAKVAGLGDAAKFETSEPEIRFSCRFDALERGTPGPKPVQRGTCIFPTVKRSASSSMTKKGRQRRTVSSASSPDCAPTRSILAWLVPGAKEGTQTCCCMTTCFALSSSSIPRRVLDPEQGLAVRRHRRNGAATTEMSSWPSHPADRLGRPARADQHPSRQSARPGRYDLRDLWNQQTPFAIADDLSLCSSSV